jgi:tetratricopeptide (TPR) repeat protein
MAGAAIHPDASSAGLPAPATPMPVAAPEPAAASARRGSAQARQAQTLPARPEPEPGVALKEWDPHTPYLAELKKAAPANAVATYLAQRRKFGASPAFYLDCAEFFRKQKQNHLALQILSNIAELETENAALLRVLAQRLQQIGQLELACGLFEEILKLRPEEPQSVRDLALALARRSESTHSRADALRAMELLAKVVNNHWDRFDEIEVIALMELNALWADFTRRFSADPARFPADARLQKLLDLDTRIVLTWDADMTDIDLHVIEPSGERAYYGHNRTTIGGLVSRDFTQGYGPEEYCLRRAMHGTYKVEVNYYGSQAAQLMGPVTVQAEVITNFGRPNEKRKSLTLRLEEKKETIAVGEIEF